MENQRVRLTKQLLREGLIALLAKKSIHKISVREICDQSQINRTTFYKYYGSPYDLLIDVEDSILVQIEAYLSVDDIRDMNDVLRLTRIISFMDENIILCRLLINNAVGSRFPERLLQLPKIQRLLGDQIVNGYRNDEADYIYLFVVNGGYSMIKSWINKEERERPEKVAELLLHTAEKVLE